MNKLLIIDDEETNVRVLSISLKADGYVTIPAYSGEEGVELFKKEEPDIVITDIRMPGMDGIEVLKTIKSLNADTEVIIVTGHGDIENAVDALKNGASDFINKPISDDALAVALDRAREKLEIRKKLRQHTEHLETEVKIATRELRRKSNFQARLIKSSNDAIIATDSQYEIVVFNPAAERIFGYTPDEIGEHTRANILYPREVMKELKTGGRHPITGELPWRETVIMNREGERIPVRFFATQLYEGEEVMGSYVSFQDLREIKRLEAELVRSERLAAVGQTVAGVAHGVKNILHGFKGGKYLVNLGIKKKNTDKIQQGWEMVQRNIERTSDLVLDLLSYSKDREPEYERCSPNEIGADVCDLLKEKAEEHHITLRTDFDPDLGEMIMDPHIIHRSLVNLMSNAIDACLFDENVTKNWEISLKTTLEPLQVARFDVTDNGSGMDEDVKNKIFSSFFSTKGHKGTGLGLLVTLKDVESHGGAIHVDSTPGVGTTFTIRLPEAEDMAGEEQETRDING